MEPPAVLLCPAKPRISCLSSSSDRRSLHLLVIRSPVTVARACVCVPLVYSARPPKCASARGKHGRCGARPIHGIRCPWGSQRASSEDRGDLGVQAGTRRLPAGSSQEMVLCTRVFPGAGSPRQGARTPRALPPGPRPGFWWCRCPGRGDQMYVPISASARDLVRTLLPVCGVTSS